MKRKPITKLFAVMAIAASPAAASPAAQPDPWAVSAAVSPFTPDESLRAMEIVISMGIAALSRAHETSAPAAAMVVRPPIAPAPAIVARPRTTPSGAPACGNVASRALPIDCGRATPTMTAGAPAPVPHVAAVPAGDAK